MFPGRAVERFPLTGTHPGFEWGSHRRRHYFIGSLLCPDRSTESIGGGEVNKLGVVLAVVGVVLTLVPFAGPWWTLGFDATIGANTIKETIDFRLFGATATATMGGITASNSTDYKSSPNIGPTFTAGAAIAGIGLVFGILMILLLAMSGAKPKLRKIGAIFGILAFILVLVAPIYVTVQLPGAVTKDMGAGFGGTNITGFWGSKTASFGGSSATLTWGAGWGWYVAVVAAVIFLIAALISFRGPTPAPTGMGQMSTMPPETPP